MKNIYISGLRVIKANVYWENEHPYLDYVGRLLSVNNTEIGTLTIHRLCLEAISVSQQFSEDISCLPYEIVFSAPYVKIEYDEEGEHTE